MAEIEYKGIKVGGSKLLLVVPLVGTIIGGLWGGFELFNRYQMMEKKIDSYVAPDLSGFDKRLEVVQQELDMVLDEVTLVADVAKDLKNDLRGDVRRIETIVEDVEQRVKNDSRELNSDIHDQSYYTRPIMLCHVVTLSIAIVRIYTVSSSVTGKK